MSKELKYKLFESSVCPSEQMLFDYLDGTLDPKAAHYVEKHSLHCELCADALEGLRLVKDRSIIQDLRNKVAQGSAIVEITHESKSNSRKWIISIAAALLILLGGTFFYQLALSDKMEGSGLAEMKEPAAANSASSDSVPLDALPPPPDASGNKQAEAEANEDLAQKAEPKNYKDQLVKQENSVAANDRTNTVSANSTGSGAAIVQNDHTVFSSPAMEQSIPILMDEEKPVTSKEIKKADDKNLENDNKANVVGAVSGTSTNKLEEISLAEKKETSKKAKAKPEKSRAATETEQTPSAPQSATGGYYVNDQSKDNRWEAGSSDGDKLDSEISADSILLHPEKPAEYKGGSKAMYQYFAKNFHYPTTALDAIQTKLYVSFVIDEKGKVGQVKIEKGINPEIDAEAIRVIKTMPDWSPATQNGKIVSSKMTIPFQIEFR